MCFGLVSCPGRHQRALTRRQIKLASAWTPNWQVLAVIRMLLGLVRSPCCPCLRLLTTS